MRVLKLLSLGLSLSVLPSSAWAQETHITKEQQKPLFDAAQLSPTAEVSGVTNLYRSVLTYRYPKYLVPAYRATSATGFLMEFVPFGEDVKAQWSEMLTITAMPAAAAVDMPASSTAIIMMGGMRARCPESFIGEDLGPVNLGGAEAHRFLFGCQGGAGGKSNAGEIAIVELIRRKGDVITVQFARRGKHTRVAPLIDERRKRYYLTMLDDLSLTDNPASTSENRPSQPSN